MHIVYLRTHDGNKPGTDRFTEVTLARRLCERGVAIPYATWKAQQVERAALDMAAKQKADVKAEAIAKEKAKPKPKRRGRPKKKQVDPAA